MTEERLARLLADLHAERRAFLAALDDVDPELAAAPGLVGEWSARELVAHMGYWADWATTCLDHAEGGRLPELETDEWDVDAQNAEVARDAVKRSVADAREREATAFGQLDARLRTLDPASLDVAPPWGGTVEEIVVEDGPAHYRQHTDHIRAWFTAEGNDDDEV